MARQVSERGRVLSRLRAADAVLMVVAIATARDRAGRERLGGYLRPGGPMRGLTWEDASGGVGLRVTVPVTMTPDEAARELAPRLSALAGERATASSHGEPARAQRGVPVVTIDGYSGSGKSTLAAARSLGS